MENVPPDQQSSILVDKQIDESRTTADCNFLKKPILYLVLRLRGTLKDKAITLNAAASVIIDSVKAMFQHMNRVPPRRAALGSGGQTGRRRLDHDRLQLPEVAHFVPGSASAGRDADLREDPQAQDCHHGVMKAVGLAATSFNAPVIPSIHDIVFPGHQSLHPPLRNRRQDRSDEGLRFLVFSVPH